MDVGGNLNTAFTFGLLHKSLQDLCAVFNQNDFYPLLESDVAAYLYYRLLTNGCPLLHLYSETRICGIAGENRKYDLVIGFVDIGLACVKPVLIAQLKCFQRWGLSHQQHRRRFEGIVTGDIESLKQASGVLREGRVEIVVDFVFTSQTTGYLNGSWNGRKRKDVLISLCSENALSLIWVHPNREGRLEVEQLV